MRLVTEQEIFSAVGRWTWERAAINKAKRRFRLQEARKKGVHTKDQWLALCEEFGGKCVCCGRENCHLDKDHIIPLFMGGSDGIENIQPLCAWCNASKTGDTTNWVEKRRATA